MGLVYRSNMIALREKKDRITIEGEEGCKFRNIRDNFTAGSLLNDTPKINILKEI